MEMSTETISLGAAAVSAVVASLALRFNVSKNIHGRIDGLQLLFDTKNEATRKEAELRADEVSARESKSRHDLANTTTNQFSKLDAAIKQIERDAVRKDEMASMETRQTAASTKIEVEVGRLREHIQDRLGKLDVVAAQSQSNAVMLEKIW
jgi:hypothetical protein